MTGYEANINEASLLYPSSTYCISIGCTSESSCCLEGGGGVILYRIGLNMFSF